MTYPEAIQFLYSLRWFGAKFGLENTLKLAALAGNPQNQLRFIHVAGTNGKGSTCAMLESIYRAAGLRVGLFTSPHLISFRERLQVNRQLISEADVVRLVTELREFVATGFQPGGSVTAISRLVRVSNRHPDGRLPPSTSGGTPDAAGTQDASPTFFEFVTVMALRYFAEQRCDLVIWETGLGGRLDATNIVTPLASVITNIGFDHQQWLGDTLAKIAAEKAGIIKPGVPALTATDEPEALAVIEKVAREKRAPLTHVGQTARLGHFLTPETKGSEPEGVSVGRLPGEHQLRNATLAVAAVRALQLLIPVRDEQIRTGLATVNWPGRLQLITRPSGQRVLLDGAHNVAGAEALRTALKGAPVSNPARPGLSSGLSENALKRGMHLLGRADSEIGAPTLILGVLADKDWPAICGILAPLARRILLVRVGSERTANPEELSAACRQAHPAAEVIVCTSLAEALARAQTDGFVVITGSLYLVGEALELLAPDQELPTDEKALNEWHPPQTAPAR